MENYPERSGRKIKASFHLNPERSRPVLVKVGLSAVDIDGAIHNIAAEIPDWDFDRVRQSAKEKWDRELSRIIIEAADDIKEIFYTAQYHTLLAPVIFMDADGRYRGLDQQIHVAKDYTNYTIYSLWDTYRATHPLFTLTQPSRVPSIITSMLNHADQSVHHILPVWSFHANETWCMIGYHAVSVIADAYLKGIRGFDTGKALEAMTASASYGPYDGLESYMEYGYVPIDKENEAASKTLEYAYDDWAIARMAAEMGENETGEQFYARSMAYVQIYDPGSGFMRARQTDGTWREPFDPFYAMYGGDYTEGNAWQYSWYVPHDVRGLIELMGGEERFVARLDSLFTLQGPAGQFKHVEDIAGLIGQYAHGNEPSQHIAYLYAYAGYPWKTQERIHQIMNNLFDNTPYGICGNEDCGQMSAWYIFSSMGFYPVCPGSNEYVIGSPCLQKATLCLDNGKTFTVKAEHLNPENKYIQSAELNGKPYSKAYITHTDIVTGGTLKFVMGPSPNYEWGSSTTDRPYSMSR
jgi:predicted alpha-1,2-mannosidase